MYGERERSIPIEGTGKPIRIAYIIGVLAAILTFLVYLPALKNEFVNWDDFIYVYTNYEIRSIDIGLLKYAFFSLGHTSWFPLTMMSFAAEYRVWGLNPWGYHLTNIVLHAIDTFLVFLVAFRLFSLISTKGNSGKRLISAEVTASAMTALLFGLHPLHVESVAWISERKDVLYAFFFLISILCYLDYCASVPGKKTHYYTAAIFTFSLSLMSKQMAITLPAILIVIDFYPLGRLSGRVKKAVMEKLPFFILSGLSAIITLLSQHNETGLVPIMAYPLTWRLANVIRGYGFYLYKMVVPMHLAAFYPLRYKSLLFTFETMAIAVIIIAVTAVCIFAAVRKNALYLSAVWLYYIITLLPVSGIVVVGPHVTADRYAYLSSIGPFLLLGASTGYLIKKMPTKNIFFAVICFIIAISVVMAVLTTRQISIWRNSVSLWNRNIDEFPHDALGRINRGMAYIKLGDHENALKDFRDAATMEINDTKRAAMLYFGIGYIYATQGDTDRCIDQFNMAISLYPEYVDAYYNRGIAYSHKGLYDWAIEDFNKAISLNPNYAEAYHNRGYAYYVKGFYTLALGDFQRSCELGNNLGCDRARKISGR